MSIANDCLILRPLSFTKVIADHGFVISADARRLYQLGAYIKGNFA